YAAWVLEREARRFVVLKGEIDSNYSGELWSGAWSDPDAVPVEILPPEGYVVGTPASSLSEAVRDAHLAGDHGDEIDPADVGLPAIDGNHVLDVLPIRISDAENSPHFRLRYEPVPGAPAIRVRSVGVDGDISRTLTMEFRIDKRIEYAVVSPNRIMIGKNVMIQGPLGTRYGEHSGELNGGNGDPLLMRSDFYYLSESLNLSLDAFYEIVKTTDVDDDGRLRPGHAVEGSALDAAGFEDLDGDEFVDDFDLFLAEFDDDNDGQVIYDPVLANDSGLGSFSSEFTDIDDQLARLIDNFRPDRNNDGVVDADDTRLGYRDGALNTWDRYAKVTGQLAFAVNRTAWETAHGDVVRSIVQGPERPDIDTPAMLFELDEKALRVVTTDMFADSAVYFRSVAAAGDSLSDQANENLASTPGAEYLSAAEAPWEETPLGSRSAYDWYQRPVYRNMLFEDVLIPTGTNALFEQCTFLGVTYVETDTQCEDVNWNYAGALERIDLGGGNYEYRNRFGDLVSSHPNHDEVPDTKVFSNNVRFDGCTFLGSMAGDTPGEYTHWRNKVQVTGATRFFVDPSDPSLDLQPDAEEIRALLETLPEEQVTEMLKSSIMMPGWSVDVGSFTNETSEDLDASPRVDLRGVVIAGILDIRGTASVQGTLLMTFHPVPGEGPLHYNGQPDAFNTTIGFFGPLDGDGEGTDPTSEDFEGFGEILLVYDPDVALPDGIPWPILAEAMSETYREGSQ
ncbi:MAG: hypothetical protein MK085_06200, partial [Phycisphaerales bacterium]|nr:hypothetical protein [Phycisphaerales bacterium]